MSLGRTPVSIVILIEMEEYNMAKHLSLDDRITIQSELTNKSSLSEIAKILGRDISTIRKEIVNHRQVSKKTGPYVVYNNCINRRNCP